MHWHIASKLHPWNNWMILCTQIYNLFNIRTNLMKFSNLNTIYINRAPWLHFTFTYCWLFSKISCKIWKFIFKIIRICVPNYNEMWRLEKICVFFKWPSYNACKQTKRDNSKKSFYTAFESHNLHWIVQFSASCAPPPLRLIFFVWIQNA